jgi:hypothetical protein
MALKSMSVAELQDLKVKVDAAISEKSERPPPRARSRDVEA